MEKPDFTLSAPGRICLFGEHQDYLGLPVIAAAVDRRMRLEVRREDPALRRYRILMPDLDGVEEIPLPPAGERLPYRRKRDYLCSVINVLRGEGVPLPGALTARIRSQIPIASGTSSSSALTVAWTAALLLASGRAAQAADAVGVARLAHRAEVLEFKESGGMMDHLSIACGGICLFDFSKEAPAEPIPASIRGLVLADSLTPKDTESVLSRVRRAAETAIRKVREALPDFDLKTTPLAEVLAARAPGLSEEERAVLLANLRNRDILREARAVLSKDPCDLRHLGALLAEHHGLLRDALKISTPRIEALLAAATRAGALGGKINGSGGGGCFFVLAPGREEAVRSAIEIAGGRAWPVKVAGGVAW